MSQVATVTGKVVDNVTKQPVVGAKLMLSPQMRTLSDPDGNYELKNIPFGKYTMVITMSSFDTLKVDMKIDKELVNYTVVLGGSQELEEIKVIGNIVSDRKTPVAVTKISTQKITEELGSRDLPMLLNGTPGIYATQTGGGDGDSRINVRGFDQRNVGVLIDGVPVNDMENGWVYWSNWFGLDAITSTVQVQRGLGASKLAMPSVGGTINILTQGVGNRKGFSFKQEFGTGNLLRSTIAYNSGMSKEGWGLTLSGSYKRSDGWVAGTQSEGFFGYIKVQKKIKKHLVSLSAFAAPQEHGQRPYNQSVQYWNSDYAQNLGIPLDSTTNFFNEGVQYNQHWGFRSEVVRDENGNELYTEKKVMSERLNYYNKPQFTLKDFWKVNDKLSISNLGYVSIGRGGGTRLSNSSILRDKNGLIDWDQIIQENQVSSLFGTPNVDPLYHPTLIKSSQVLLSTVNNHFWAGYLGQFNYEYSKKLMISGGLDYRYYEGEHYQEIRDLLGGDYYVETSNQNAFSAMKVVGDKVAMQPYNNHRDGLVNWFGAFGQAEYTGTRWTYFVNLSFIYTGYKGIDYFRARELDLGDTVLLIGNDPVEYNGKVYNTSSEGLTYNNTGWKYLPGMTAKVGGSYALTEQSTVFVNAGYLSRTPQFSNVVDNNTNTFFREIVNEKILAFEGGYNFANKSFGVNVNGYFTNWQNKPFPFGVQVPDPNDPTEFVRINVNGMDAIHYGGEIDVAYKISKKWSTEFMFSLGDWTWNSTETVFIPQYDSLEISFDAKGVHVGDAAQTALSLALRFDPIKHLYFKVQGQYFDRYYSQFDPFTLQDQYAGREAWKIPAYYLVNLFAGYKFDLKAFDIVLNGSVTNFTDLGSVFDWKIMRNDYIADAQDNKNTPFQNSDAQSANVMYGMGFRFNLSLGIQF
jgi:outer membrane receptor for ferrienterochelin and colicin